MQNSRGMKLEIRPPPRFSAIVRTSHERGDGALVYAAEPALLVERGGDVDRARVLGRTAGGGLDLYNETMETRLLKGKPCKIVSGRN